MQGYIMCAKKEEYQGDCSQPIHSLHHNEYSFGGATTGGLIFPQLPCSMISPAHALNPLHFDTNPVPVRDHAHIDPFRLPPPPSSYGGLFDTRASATALSYFAYDGSPANHLSILSDAFRGVGSAPFGLQSDHQLGKISAQEIMDAKALAASKSHSEAERRRRERINNHFAKLRSLLPSATKTDKASLLAEVIQHVKELKRQTCLIAETSPVPSELDELSVDTSDGQDGLLVIKASLCCEDRSDLLADLIKTLKSLRLKTLKAEITTLGGRVKNVLFITGEEDSSCNSGDHRVGSIQEALEAVMEKTCGNDQSSSGTVKRQRTNIRII